MPSWTQAPTVPGAAQWIAPAGDSTGVYDFRRIVLLAAAPKRWLVSVTADNRFQLFINGQRVGEGPAREPATLVSRCTQMPESRLFVFNLFPEYKYKYAIMSFICIGLIPRFECKQLGEFRI
jgi:hypothetical protein